MAVYNSRNMDRMRMEAVRRSQEMHSRSRQAGSVSEGNPKHTESISTGKIGLPDLISRLFPDGKADKDLLLTAALMYLLYKEGADMKLILALAYILI